MVEVGMSESLCGCDPLSGIIDEEFEEEILAETVEGVESERVFEIVDGLLVVGHDVVFVDDFVVERESLEAGPALGSGDSEGPADSEDHVDFAVALEEDLAQDQLCEDAAQRPHVHSGRVVLHAQQQLGRAVVQSHHRSRVRPHRQSVRPGHPQVRDLHHHPLLRLDLHQDVRGLQVSVDHAAVVHVVHRGNQLVHHVLYHQKRQSLALLLQILPQVEFDIFEDQVDFPLLDLLVQKSNDASSLQLLQKADLSDGHTRNTLVLHLVAHLLYSHVFVHLLVKSLHHLPISPLPN